jgi:adenylyltransferase/sulfurtransferase
MQYIDPKDLKNLLDSHEAMLLDIRDPYEYAICSIGGTQIPMAEVISRINELPSDKKIVIMCRSGKRAEAMANVLVTEHERSNVAVLEGGILGWIESVDNTLEAY